MKCVYCEEGKAEYIYEGSSICITCLNVTKVNLAENFMEGEKQ